MTEINREGLEAVRRAIRYLNDPSTPWSDEQVSAVIRAYLPFHTADAGLVEALADVPRYRLGLEEDEIDGEMRAAAAMDLDPGGEWMHRLDVLAALRSQAPAGVDGEKPEPEWRDMADAPRNGTEIVLRVPCKGYPEFYRQIGHWGEDLSGSEQPPFRGWFKRWGSSGFAEIDPDPTGWMPLYASPPAPAAEGAPVVYQVEESEGIIRLSVGGVEVCAHPDGTPQAIALLKYDAASRPTSEGEA